MMKPKEIVRSFIEQKLDGDIERLEMFKLGSLFYDKTYGCPGRKFDSDDTNLMRAIYCIVFGKTWENLSMDNSGAEKLRGDTINTFNSLFARPWETKDPFVEKWNPDEAFLMKRKTFNDICYTMGNMMILPDRRLNGWSINTHRGCHDEWHDYEDRFLAALYKVLTNAADKDDDLQELVELNKADFLPFYGERGWKHFIEGNMLEYYVDDTFKPIISSKGYVYWRGGYTNHNRFFVECNRYIDFATAIIHDRALRMIKILKNECYK
jgi:hypothetical protein